MADIIGTLGGLTSAAISLQNGLTNMTNPNGVGGIDTSNGIAGVVSALTIAGGPLSIAANITAGYTSLLSLAQSISDFNSAPSGSDAATSAAIGVATARVGRISLRNPPYETTCFRRNALRYL